MTDKSGWDLAEEGIKVSYENAADTWKEDALQAVFLTAQEMEFFTVDDVWARFPDGLKKANGSALGHVMLTAKNNGWIVKSGEAKRSTRPVAHCKYNPLWQSLLKNERAA